MQKLSKSFFGEIEFLAPSCSAGSALATGTLLEKYIDVFVNYARVAKLRKSTH